MKNFKNNLYHIHRIGRMDDVWNTGNTIDIDNNYQTAYYKTLIEEENRLIKRYGNNYDIDFIVAMVEELQFEYAFDKDKLKILKKLINNYYFLRREKAMEEGRKIFASDAPSRFYSLYLTDKNNLNYWIKKIGANSYKVFLLETEGREFVSSDQYFPDCTRPFEVQVEQSKEYWQPKIKKLTPHQEILFQGVSKIIQ